MKKQLLLLAAAACGWFIAGCQNTVNTVKPNVVYAQPTAIDAHQVVTDGFLHQRLQVTEVRSTPGPGGNMVVEVTAVNCRVTGAAQAWSSLTGENPYPVDYKFTWLDDKGMTVDTPLSIWKRVLVKPGETVSFKSVAPDLRCKDFRLSLKEGE